MFFWEKKVEIGKILRQLCKWKEVRLINAKVCPDHVHTLLEILLKVAISSLMGYLKEISILVIYMGSFLYCNLNIAIESFGAGDIT